MLEFVKIRDIDASSELPELISVCVTECAPQLRSGPRKQRFRAAQDRQHGILDEQPHYASRYEYWLTHVMHVRVSIMYMMRAAQTGIPALGAALSIPLALPVDMSFNPSRFGIALWTRSLDGPRDQLNTVRHEWCEGGRVTVGLGSSVDPQRTPSVPIARLLHTPRAPSARPVGDHCTPQRASSPPRTTRSPSARALQARQARPLMACFKSGHRATMTNQLFRISAALAYLYEMEMNVRPSGYGW